MIFITKLPSLLIYQVIGDEKAVQEALVKAISPLLLLEINFQVLPTKHLESAKSKEFTLIYSDPG